MLAQLKLNFIFRFCSGTKEVSYKLSIVPIYDINQIMHFP